MGTVVKKPEEGVVPCFKDSQGRFRTQSLFWEMRHPEMSPVFTTKKYNHEDCISMYLKYMEIGDPTEYQVAIKLLGSWDHWLKLCELPWFKEMADEWRDELKKRMESERYVEMTEIIRDNPGSPQAIQATKWLDQKYGQRPKSKRGRPSKIETKAALKQEKEELKEQTKIAQEIGLV